MQDKNLLPSKRIVSFLKKHHVLTLATSCNNLPWTANCFYVYLEDSNQFIFTSDTDTRHIQEAVLQPLVAGSVVLETKIIGKIQGVQFEGILFKPNGKELKIITRSFLLRFPYAVIKNTDMWAINITHLKMTDNRLGFGKKIIWKKTL